MNITINGNMVNGQCASAGNLEEALVQLANNAVPENHLVGTVVVNGNEFSELYPGQARDIGLERVMDLDIKTVSLEQVAGAALKDSSVLITRIIDSANRTAELFRMYDEAEAFENFINLLESFRDLFKFIDTTRNTINWDFEGTQYNGHTVQDEWSKLINIIDEIKTTQEEGDLILLADLIEYEIVPMLTNWIAIFETKSAEYNNN